MTVYKIGKGDGTFIDGFLINQLDTLIYNVKKDWDFVILVSGDRMVRVGKSVIALQMGAYLAQRLGKKLQLPNVIFDSEEMIKYAQKAPPNSVIIYDEGREGLAATKSQQTMQKDLLDYFAECGQLNHIFIIVLPDFFELKENIAVGRSEFLINVWRREIKKMVDLYGEGKTPVVKYERGYFEFFSKRKKQLLYDLSKSTRKKSYQIVTPNFKGRFTNYYPVDEEKYREKKKKALARFAEKKKEEKFSKLDIFRDSLVMELRGKGKKYKEISEFLEEHYKYYITEEGIGKIVRRKLNNAKKKAENPDFRDSILYSRD